MILLIFDGGFVVNVFFRYRSQYLHYISVSQRCA